MNIQSESILPRFDVLPVQQHPGAGMGAYARPIQRNGASMGSVFALSPVVAAMKGLGAQDADGDFEVKFDRLTAGEGILAVAILAAVGALSYQAGKAMAPSGGDKVMWGWVGVPVGLFTGVLGLGAMGFVANRKGG